MFKLVDLLRAGITKEDLEKVHGQQFLDGYSQRVKCNLNREIDDSKTVLDEFSNVQDERVVFDGRDCSLAAVQDADQIQYQETGENLTSKIALTCRQKNASKPCGDKSAGQR